MKIIKRIFAFFFFSVSISIVSTPYFPVSEDGVLIVPNWYQPFWIVLSVVCLIVVVKGKEWGTAGESARLSIILLSLSAWFFEFLGGAGDVEWPGLFFFITSFVVFAKVTDKKLKSEKQRKEEMSVEEQHDLHATNEDRQKENPILQTGLLPKAKKNSFTPAEKSTSEQNKKTENDLPQKLKWPDQYVCISVKTTGLDESRDEIVELAAIRYVHGREINRYQSLVKPNMPMTDQLCKINDLTNEMLENAPPIRQALLPFLQFIELDTLVSHNIEFDIKFIWKACFREKFAVPANDKIDTRTWSKEVFPFLYSYRKVDVMDHLRLKRSWSGRAIEDCKDLNKLHQGLLEMSMPKRN